MKKITLFICLLFAGHFANAALFCPPDVTLQCFDDLTNTDLTGYPAVTGTDLWYHTRYVDNQFLTDCDEGFVERTWYVDRNNDGLLDAHDVFCTHIITLERAIYDITIEFPEDITVSCIEDVETIPPMIYGGPCDHLGYNIDVHEITIVQDACYKLHHVYRVINWCDYDANDPNTEGLWTHTRVIKVIDNDKPVFDNCEHSTYEVEADCETAVTLTKNAIDVGNCSSDLLVWRAEVDLWADGTTDLFYGPDQSGIFRLEPAASGVAVSISLPERLSVSNHKVKWSVTDGCANYTSCYTTFDVVDLKPPTPYCLAFMTAAFEGDHGPLEIPVSLFDRGGFDNCTAQGDLRFSFSSNLDDTIQTVACGQEGFKFFRIYVTDEFGNQDFCNVFSVIFDNGSCDGAFAPRGQIVSAEGDLMEFPDLYMMDGGDMISVAEPSEVGQYQFESLPLMSSYRAEAGVAVGNPTKVDIEDLVLLQRHLLGINSLVGYSALAGDVDQDGALKIRDLEMLRDHVLGVGSWTPDLISIPLYMTDVAHGSASSIPYGEYREGFDFVSFSRGNISDLLTSEVTDDIGINVTFEGNMATITNTDEMAIAGLLIDFPAFIGEVILAEQLELHPFGKYYRAGEYTVKVKLKNSDQQAFLSYLQDAIKIVDHKTNTKANILISNSSEGEADIQELTATEQIGSAAFSVYPNPSMGQFTIEGEGITNILVHSAVGKVIPVASTKIETGVKVDLDAKSGVYYLQYEAAGANNVVKLVVVN